MIKHFNKKSVLVLTTIFSLIIVVQAVYAMNNEPGTQGDPLVTLSYVEQRMEQLKFYIDDKIESLPQSGGNVFVVVNIKAGQTLIAKEGTEIILRTGKANAVASAGGGLSDVTAAKDIKNNAVIPANHLLIIPRDDGRGVKAITDIILMVKGNYDIN